MRFVLIVLLMFLATTDGMADTSRQEKIAYIIETEDFRGQIIAYKDEMIKRSIKELNTALNKELDNQTKDIIKEETVEVIGELLDNYITDIADVYVEYLTDDEIDAIYRFYRSPEGISFGSKLSAIGRKIFWIDARYLELVSDRAVSRITERLSEEGYN